MAIAAADGRFGRGRPIRGQIVCDAPYVRHANPVAAHRTKERRRALTASVRLSTAMVHKINPTVRAKSVAANMRRFLPVRWNERMFLLFHANYTLQCPCLHEPAWCQRPWQKSERSRRWRHSNISNVFRFAILEGYVIFYNCRKQGLGHIVAPFLVQAWVPESKPGRR